jgi:Viral BACON domain
MHYCTGCGGEFIAADRFCGRCGHQLEAAPEQTDVTTSPATGFYPPPWVSKHPPLFLTQRDSVHRDAPRQRPEPGRGTSPDTEPPYDEEEYSPTLLSRRPLPPARMVAADTPPVHHELGARPSVISAHPLPAQPVMPPFPGSRPDSALAARKLRKAGASSPRRLILLVVIIVMVCVVLLAGIVGLLLIPKTATVPPSPYPQPARPVLTTFTLDFGKVEQRRKVILAVGIRNVGQLRLIWTADSLGIPWLKLQPITGTLLPGTLPQEVYVTADTSRLALGTYKASLRISSSAGAARVGTTLTVVPPGSWARPQMRVSPPDLDFGIQPVGKQEVLAMTVGNVGAETLTWRTQTRNAPWLTLARPTGKIAPGGFPQTVYLVADTSHLTRGNYLASVDFTSNGGASQVTVLLGVTGSPPPTDILPAGPPPTLTVKPTAFTGNTDCSYAQGEGWMCLASVSNTQQHRGPLNWATSSSGIKGIAFYPSKGMLLPGQSGEVNVLVPDTRCPAAATLSFKGPANAVTVAWRCTPPPLQLIAVPSSFNGNADCPAPQGQGWRCVAMLSTNGQGKLAWTASSSQSRNVSFTPATGTLLAGQTMQVTIAIADRPCPASLTFTLKGPTNTVNIPWHCSPPSPPLLGGVSPNPLAFGTLTQGDSKTVQEVISNSGGQALTWNADTGGASWLTLDTSSGSVAPGEQQTINVTVNTTGLAAGLSTATLTINSNGGTQAIAITVTVQ